MNCRRCKDIYGFRDSHYIFQINIDNNFPIDLCNKHKNFKPNKAIVWLQHKYAIHWTYPRHYMRVKGCSYKQGKLEYYGFKLWQKDTYLK